MTISKGFC